jgi:hypothetical protein
MAAKVNSDIITESPSINASPELTTGKLLSNVLESQIGRVGVAALLDQQIISFLATTLTKSLRGIYSIIGTTQDSLRENGDGDEANNNRSSWIDSWTEEIAFGVELVYSLLSMFPIVDGTPAMKALSLTWSGKSWSIPEGLQMKDYWSIQGMDKSRIFSAVLYAWLLLLEHVTKKMRSLSMTQGTKQKLKLIVFSSLSIFLPVV